MALYLPSFVHFYTLQKLAIIKRNRNLITNRRVIFMSFGNYYYYVIRDSLIGFIEDEIISCLICILFMISGQIGHALKTV